MAVPNQQLQAALTQFANEPGVTPQQVAELRVSIVGNSSLLSSLNADAAQGHLNGFSIAPLSTPSIGRYDVTNGTMILPSEAFSGGPPANSDLRAVLRLQDMSLRFSQLPGVTQDMHDNLQRTINDSPALIDQFKAAVRSDQTNAQHLRSFDLHTQGVAGGSYNPTTRAMNLVPASLTSGTFDQYNMSFVLGHEMEHGFNRTGVAQARANFDSQMRAIASDGNPVNDYTAPSVRMMQVHRDNEAEAHIAGWNAMLSYERQRSSNPNTGLQEMWNNASRGRVVDFLELDASNNAVARPGISFNADGTLSSTPSNVAAMGRHYFDQPPAGTSGVPAQDTVNLGPHGHSDYANLYGAEVIGRAIWAERNIGVPKHGNPSEMHVNLQRLGVNETLMEENGIYISPGSTASQTYRDTSTTPPTVGRFDHTYDGPNKHQHMPIDAPAMRSPTMHRHGVGDANERSETTQDQPGPLVGISASLPVDSEISPVIMAAMARRLPADMRDPTHPAHPEFTSTLSEVHRMESAKGVLPGPHSELAAAALMVEAGGKHHGITNVELDRDGQIKGTARYGAFSPEKQVSVSSSKAMSESMEQYSTQWAQLRSPHLVSSAPAANRTREQEQVLSQLSPNDQSMFAKIRTETPGQIPDGAVLQALLAAKKDGIERTDQIGRTSMFGDKLLVEGTTPGFRGVVDVTEMTPTVEKGVQQTQTFNQIREQQLTQESLDRGRDAPGGPSIGPRM